MCNYTYILALQPILVPHSPQGESRSDGLEPFPTDKVPVTIKIPRKQKMIKMEPQPAKVTSGPKVNVIKRKAEEEWIFEPFNGDISDLKADPHKFLFCMQCDWKKEEQLPGV